MRLYLYPTGTSPSLVYLLPGLLLPLLLVLSQYYQVSISDNTHPQPCHHHHHHNNNNNNNIIITTMPASLIKDVLVIGGGPGGLAVATSLARQLYTAVVFDSGVYRNARTRHMHNVPTWDHRDPREFRAKARSDLLARYHTIHFEDTAVESVRRTDDGRFFEATDAKGTTWTGKKVVLATGIRDIYPDVPGYDDVWGRGLYHCLFCDGYEDRGAASAGVLAIGDMGPATASPASTPAAAAIQFPALHVARMAKRLAKKVVIHTNGAPEFAKELAAAIGSDPAIVVDDRPVTRLQKANEESSEIIVHLEDGTTVSHGFMVCLPPSFRFTQSPLSLIRLMGIRADTQAKIRGQWAIRPSAWGGVHGDGLHQDESAFLRDDCPGCVCYWGLRNPDASRRDRPGDGCVCSGRNSHSAGKGASRVV
jgi:hypothetical protein